MSLRSVAKATLRTLSHVAVLPLLIVHAVKVPFIGKHRALEGSTQLLSLVPGISGQYLRRAFLAWTIAECRPSAAVCFGTIFSRTDARIGDNVYLGPRCMIGSVVIENDVLIASGVHITSGRRMHGTADPTRPIREQEGVYETVRIGRGSWIGERAIVMADVGENSIIGAGAVVSKPIPPWVTAVGVPARVLRSRHAEQPAREESDATP